MARQLYDYWFVQFDFPDENGRPYKSSGGKMVWNEKLKREIPEGWEETSIEALCDINSRSLSTKDDLREIEYLDTSNLTENVISETQRIKRADAPSRAQRKVREYSILYSTVRPRLKHFGILCNPPQNFIVSTGFAVLDAKEDYAFYLYLWLTSNLITEHLGNLADTAVSAYPSINPSDIASLLVALPPDRCLKLFNETINPLYRVISDNQVGMKSFGKMRDDLLPLLMNSQVSVRQLNNHL